MSDWEVKMAVLEQSVENLNHRMEKVESKLDDIHDQMAAGQQSLVKVIIGAAGTIVAGLLSTIVVMLMGI